VQIGKARNLFNNSQTRKYHMLLLIFKILYKYRYSYDIEDIECQHDVLPSAM